MAFTPGRSVTCGLSSGTSEYVTEKIAEDDGNTESETESISASSEGVKKPKKFRSDVQDFFTKMPGGKKVLCGFCKNECSYLGATSNLREHLLRYHKEKYKRNESGSRNGNGKGKTNVDGFIVRSKCPPSRGKKITELKALMVAKVLRPAAVVDREGFKQLLFYLESGYVIPSSEHIMDVVRRKYIMAKEKLKRILIETSIL